jgi:hypothetical protein
MSLDPTTPIGKLRLRIADWSDSPFLPDSVYQSVLDDNSGNLYSSAKTLATFILGILSQRTHRKLSTLEVWGAEAFANYKSFLLLTVTNPAFMDLSPLPYSASGCGLSPILQFKHDWDRNFTKGTQSQQLAFDALYSPNDGSLYGIFGLADTTY